MVRRQESKRNTYNVYGAICVTRSANVIVFFFCFRADSPFRTQQVNFPFADNKTHTRRVYVRVSRAYKSYEWNEWNPREPPRFVRAYCMFVLAYGRSTSAVWGHLTTVASVALRVKKNPKSKQDFSIRIESLRDRILQLFPRHKT